MDTVSIQALALKQIINQLTSTNIRSPLKESDCSRWLNQFRSGEEQLLGLLILRYLIYRSNEQLLPCLNKALKSAVHHFCKQRNTKCSNVNWRSILANSHPDINFIIGPSKSEHSSPGRSGEVITQLLKKTLPNIETAYPADCIEHLQDNQVFLLVDDAVFTSTQLKGIIDRLAYLEPKIRDGNNFAVILGMTHINGVEELKDSYPNIKIFCGESLTTTCCFESLTESWIAENRWPKDKSSPLEVYEQIVERAAFKSSSPLGFGSLGALVAFERHIPDNSLQILWDKSANWNALI